MVGRDWFIIDLCLLQYMLVIYLMKRRLEGRDRVGVIYGLVIRLFLLIQVHRKVNCRILVVWIRTILFSL